MYTILKSEKYEVSVLQSKFISYLIHIENLADFDYFYKNLKKEHKKARHICYAYILNDTYKYSDDGEPSSTAGLPIYNVLKGNELKNVALFVVRYFGGTLLGSGRLLRTYSLAAKEVVNLAKKVKLSTFKFVEASIDYQSFDSFKNYLNINNLIINKTLFNDKIFIEFRSPLDFNENDLETLFYPSLKIENSHIKEIIMED